MAAIIKELSPVEPKEKVVQLGSLDNGVWFRPAHIPFDEATNKDDPDLYMVIESPEAQKVGKKAIVPIDGRGGVTIRDPEHFVIQHHVEFRVARNIPKLDKKKK